MGAKRLSRGQSFQLFVIPSEHDGVKRVFALTDGAKALLLSPDGRQPRGASARGRGLRPSLPAPSQGLSPSPPLEIRPLAQLPGYPRRRRSTAREALARPGRRVTEKIDETWVSLLPPPDRLRGLRSPLAVILDMGSGPSRSVTRNATEMSCSIPLPLPIVRSVPSAGARSPRSRHIGEVKTRRLPGVRDVGERPPQLSEP